MTGHRLLVLAMVAVAHGALEAQPRPAPSTATIMLRGRVTAVDGGGPLRRARIDVKPGDVEPLAFTDGSGAFELRVRPGSSYTLTASKAGFVTGTASTVAPARATNSAPLEIELVRGGVIAGRAFDSLGNPLANLRIRARRVETAGQRPSASSQLATTTDDRGEYRLSGLTAGRYVVGVFTTLGASSPAAAPTNVSIEELERLVREAQAEQERLKGLVAAGAVVATPPKPEQLVLTGELAVNVESGQVVRVTHDRLDAVSQQAQARVVEGRVLDEFGEPVEGLVVDLFRLGYLAGGRVLEGSAASDVTDDLGEFRLSGVGPGSYFVAARPSGDERARFIYALSFFPDRAGLGEAQAVLVEGDRDVSGVTITFAPSRTVSLRGVVVDSSRQANLAGSVVLSAINPSGVISLGSEVRLADDGGFEFPTVAPGDYVLNAVGKGSAGAREMGVTPVNVAAGDVNPVVISTARGTRIRGRIVIDGAPPAGGLSKFGFGVAPADPSYARMVTVYEGGFVRDDGTFEMTEVFGPGRLHLAASPDGWWIESVLLGGRETADTPILFGTQDLELTVVLSSRGSRVGFRLPGEPVLLQLRSSIAILPIDQSLWFYKSRHLRVVRPGMSTVLPPGEYWVTFVSSPYADTALKSWNADTLNDITRGALRVVVREGESGTVDLTGLTPGN